MALQNASTVKHYHRANRAGALLLIMTLCQYLIPTVAFWLLRVIWDVDTEARAFGLTSAAYLCIYLTIYCVMMGIPLWLGSRRVIARHITALSPLNLSVDRQACVVVCGVALCCAANLIAGGISLLGQALGLPAAQPQEMGDGSILTLLFDLMVYAVVPAVMEEALLRGIILQTLRPMGNGVAVGVSAVLFALMHGDAAQIPYALLMGIVLGAFFVYTDDLRLTVIIHALSNALTVITVFLQEFSSSSTATVFQCLLFTAVAVAGIVCCLWLRRHPLGRSRPVYDTSLKERLTVLAKAPLLWSAVVVMLVLIVIGNTLKG